MRDPFLPLRPVKVSKSDSNTRWRAAGGKTALQLLGREEPPVKGYGLWGNQAGNGDQN